MGFSRTSHQGTTFYYKPTAASGAQHAQQQQAAEGVGQQPWGPPLPPVVFLHGVGLGLLPYLLVRVGCSAVLRLLPGIEWRMRVCGLLCFAV